LKARPAASFIPSNPIFRSVRRAVSRRRALLVAIASAMLAAGAFATLRKSSGSIELRVYTEAARRMWQGEPLYLVGAPKPFTYPPFFALLFVPLAALPQAAHRLSFYVANVAILGAVVWALDRQLRALGPGVARWGARARGTPRGVSVWHR
jgi:hypothetical protein